MSRGSDWVLLLAIVIWGGAQALAGGVWQEITGPPDLDFPKDHGAHKETRTEWWYVTGLVVDAEGRRRGFQITFFRQGFAPGAPEPGSSPLRARQIGAAHLAIADIAAGDFHHAERLRRSGGGLAGWSETDLDVWLEDWIIRRDETGVIVVRARDAATGIGLDLELRPQRPLVLHGDAGYSQKGAAPGNASAYLSWTRLTVTGRIEVSGEKTEAAGQAWFDHEWGSSQLGGDVVGWDWFGLRLDDGRDLMVYRLRRRDGSADPHSSGTMIAADGVATRLHRDDVEIEPLKWWKSPSNGGRYPVGWRLRIPAHDINLEITGLLPSSELDGSSTTGVIYWEGPVEITGNLRR